MFNWINFFKIFAWIVLIAFYSCTNSKVQESSSGVVLLVTKQYDSASHEYRKSKIFPEIKCWYKDGAVIEEIKHVGIISGNNNQKIFSQNVDHYTYIDLKNGRLYNYSSFSDTARLLKNYTKENKHDIEGLNLFEQENDNINKTPYQLQDTVINDVLYKKYIIYYPNPYTEHHEELALIGYARCDKRGTLFQYFKGLKGFKNCPVVRIDYPPSKNDPHAFSFEFKFLSDLLTAEELKLFDVWEKNALSNR